MAARKAPQLFSRFVLICPAAREEYSTTEPEGKRKDARLHPIFKLLTLPVFGQMMLNALTSRCRLEADGKQRLFFHEGRAESGFVARLHTAAHQPGSATALAAHFTGVLGGPWRKAWSTLAAPSLIVWGREAEGFSGAPEWLALKPDAELEVFDNARLLPHMECAGDFNARVLNWLRA
jgi:pimeloyl-ACP methyl ester carboxylesterase